MIKKLLISLVLLATLIETSAWAIDFSYSTRIDITGNKKYKAVRLTPEIYNNMLPDMPDLELFDKNNEPVPYFTNSFTESKSEIQDIYELVNVNSFIKDEYFYYDYALKAPQSKDITATSIEVKTDRDGFAKKIELYGGYDNVSWEKVQDDILYNVDSSRKLEITFGSIKKYTYYRFKIANNLEKVSFTSVVLNYNKSLQKKEYFIDIISPDFTVEERGKATVIKVPSFKNLKLGSVSLKTDSMFKRNVTFDGKASKMLYSLEFEKTDYRDLTIPLGSYKVTNDTAEIVIDNKDDKPIEILGIEAKYLYDEIIFDGSKTGVCTLRFGNSEIKTPRSYDISNYREQILNEGYDVLTIAEIRSEAPKASPKPQYDYKLIFNITVTVVAVAMGLLIVLKLKKV